MKVTFKDIRMFEDAYPHIAEKSLPLTASYKLASLHRKSAQELEFYKDRFAAYVDAYAERGEDGALVVSENGGVKIAPKNIDECNKKLQELDNMEIQFSDYPLILDDFAKADFTPMEIEAMLPFLAPLD